MKLQAVQMMLLDEKDGPDPTLGAAEGKTTALHVDRCDDVYDGIARHQRTENWFGRDLAAVMQTWAERFNLEFKLQVPQISLRIDRLRCTRLGHFRPGHNGFGLKGEVALNSLYLTPTAEAVFGKMESLGTLLHELLHAWQQAHGKPGARNYPNIQFRTKALSLGLIVDDRGHTTYALESPFKVLLRQYGVDVPLLDYQPGIARRPGNSKLKKWSCGCTNARCAVPELAAQCLKCGCEFQRRLG